MNPAQLKELLLQSLVHEKGGVLVYRTALECVRNDDLREEWEKYLAQTENHVVVLKGSAQRSGSTRASARRDVRSCNTSARRWSRP